MCTSLKRRSILETILRMRKQYLSRRRRSKPLHSRTIVFQNTSMYIQVSFSERKSNAYKSPLPRITNHITEQLGQSLLYGRLIRHPESIKQTLPELHHLQLGGILQGSELSSKISKLYEKIPANCIHGFIAHRLLSIRKISSKHVELSTFQIL